MFLAVADTSLDPIPLPLFSLEPPIPGIYSFRWPPSPLKRCPHFNLFHKLPVLQCPVFRIVKRRDILRTDRRIVLRTRADKIPWIELRSRLVRSLKASFFCGMLPTRNNGQKTGILIVVAVLDVASSPLKKLRQIKRRYGCHDRGFRLRMMILS